MSLGIDTANTTYNLLKFLLFSYDGRWRCSLTVMHRCYLSRFHSRLSILQLKKETTRKRQKIKCR